MAGGKSYRRRYWRGNSDKYSVEHTAFTTNVGTAATSSVVVVPSTAVRGMRKVKHLTVSLAASQSETVFGVYWALVYVPEGYTPQAFQVPTAENASVDLYLANQYVMSCGVIDFDAGPQRISTRLSRNLNSGDSIVLLMRSVSGTLNNLQGVVQYAITLQ